MCTGTVISPTHVLTAGHCFDVEADGVPDAGITGTFNLHDGSDFSSTHTVSQVNIHPDFGGFSNGGNDDLSIIELATPVPSSTNIFSIRAGEISEGEVLQMVGYGQSGHGDTGFTVLPSFDVKRVGANEADLFVVDDEGSGVDEVYFFDFDGPTGSGFFGGTTLGNDVETSVGGGDSGGPAFVEVEGQKVLAGVSTFNWELPGTTAPVGFFGSLGGGIILNAYTDWIVSIVPNAIDSNDAPTFTPGDDVVVVEDADEQSINWASDISANNSGQTVEFHIVSNSNPSLFEEAPTINANGTLTFTAKPDLSGTAEITIVLEDDGGTEHGGQNTSTPHTLLIEVLPVNDAPSFGVGADVVVLRTVGPQAISGFANGFDPGPLEASQSVAEYVVETDNPGIFLAGPEVDVNGQLTFTPRRTTSGVANVSIQVRDTGGTANGGVDTSEVIPFSITIEPEDPAPVPPQPQDLAFSLLGNIESTEDTKSKTEGFAFDVGEDVIGFQLVSDNEELFQVQPRINDSGRLRFDPKPDAFGVVNLKAIAFGATGESESQEFSITINPVNDAPSASIDGDIRVTQGSGAHRISDFATDFDPGNSFESSQNIQQFVLKFDNEDLFTRPPSIDANGVLSFALSNEAGSANVAVAVQDDGGTADGGRDTSEGYEFSINVVPDLESPPTAVIRDGRLVVQGLGQQMLGLDFKSEAGLLSVDSSAAPFDFFLANTPEHVSLGSLGPDNAVTVDGDLVTSILYSGSNPEDDLIASWGELYGGSETFEVTVETPAVTGSVRNGRIAVSGTGQKLLGLDFQSQAGLLSNDESAAPFGFFLAEQPEHVSLGALGPSNAVTLDGELITSVYYAGTNPERDLTAMWGETGGKSVEFDITVDVPELNAVVRNGRIVVEGSGQQLIGLDFQSEAGLLTSDASAAPFGFYLSETPQHVSLGVLGPDNAVTLDGSLVTSVGYSGTDPANDLEARWGDLSAGHFAFNVSIDHSSLSGFVDDNNYVVLEGTGQEVVGLDFKSPDGQLVPLEAGEESPFQVVLSNTSEHISVGLLGDSVTVDGLLWTNVQYVGDVDRLSVQWGDPSSGLFDLPITRSNDPCANASLQTLSQCADDLSERDAILAQLGHVLGDIEGDGTVDFGDFLQLADSFGNTNQNYVDGDLDLDGIVGFSDFLLLADNFGKSA